MKLYPKTVGTRRFDDSPVTVTDPCYDAGSWGTLENLTVEPGVYTCVAWKGRLSYTDPSTKKRVRYSRVFVAGIYLNNVIPDENDGWMECGRIGVDAGLAGFFQNKPDYDDEAWLAFCDRLSTKDWLITPEGFCTSSGYGDGMYPVYSHVNLNGVIDALEIRF